MSKNNSLTKIQKQIKDLGIDIDAYEDDYVELEDVENFNNGIDESLKNFNNLLDSMSTTEERKKVLWKQIFEFALADRRNSFLLFSDLYKTVVGNPAEHAIHGQNLSKYLERMSKANDQIIKLAEIVDAEVQNMEEDIMNEDNLYEQFNKQNK